MGGVGKSLEKTYKKSTDTKHVEILAVLQTVTNYPCLNATRIAEKLQVNPGTVRWHLKKLEEKHLIESVRQGGKIVYYTRGFVVREDVEDIGFLQKPEVRILITRIARAHGASKKGVLDTLEMNKPSMAYVYIQHLDNLVDKGFVRVLKDRKMNYYYLTDKLFKLYKKYSEIEVKIGSAAVRNFNGILPELQPGARAALEEMNFREGGMVILITAPFPTPGLLAEYKLRLNPLWSYQEVIQPE
ncbi:MAG: winged helix-turn-helix transcriptional regulator [Thermoplasmata archaeon]|nr:winged helix-turn-helix transcriptional regulator [Thermoplasmata archaeon]